MDTRISKKIKLLYPCGDCRKGTSIIMRYFLRLSYNGTGFLGWQIQPQGMTVQGTIEAAMAQLLRQPIGITGAGRTDTGVNARMMIAHFDYDGELPATFVRSLNAMVGRNIAIEDVWPVAADAHARFDAKERTYRYYATIGKSPFLYPLTWQASPMLDFEAMNRAAEYLIGRQDFTSFSKLHTQVKTNICDVRRALWKPCTDWGEEASPITCAPADKAPGLWYFEISADRFLRNMVRAVVGTLVDVGRGKMPAESVADILAQRDRCCAGTSMPPQALYLWDIVY